MTITSTKQRHAGFTLVEMMVSVVLLAIVLTSLTGTFLVFLKGAASVGLYSEMSAQSRKGLELFSRDVRSASGITVMNPSNEGGSVVSSDGISLTYPDYIGTKAVQYRYDASADELVREQTVDGTAISDVLLSGVGLFKLTFFQTPGGSFTAIPGPVASVNNWTKSIQMDAELQRTVASIETTDSIISARFMLRNFK
jgi:prepilin-type N-terminal cleavage/methylation domain-containing protein